MPWYKLGAKALGAPRASNPLALSRKTGRRFDSPCPLREDSFEKKGEFLWRHWR